MMRKLFGWLFGPWTLFALALSLVLAALWLYGPILALGDGDDLWRPLAPVAARATVSAVLLVIVAMAVAWRARRSRRGNAQVVQTLTAAPAAASETADLAAVRERFADALKQLRHTRFLAVTAGANAATSRWLRLRERLTGRYLYELPWFLIIGAPGTGKTTALRNAGLRFPLAKRFGDHAIRGVGGTRDCDWWFTDQAVLIDTAGRFTTQDSDQHSDSGTWQGFLKLLKTSRPRQPLNGVLVTLAMPDLLTQSAAQREQLAQTVRARIQELHQHLGLRLPVYLLVTKCDLMAGFTETMEPLDKPQRATPWGFTFSLQPAAFEQALEPEFETLLKGLDASLVDRLQAEADPVRRARIYGFPNQFANVKAPLVEMVHRIFAPSPFEADPLLRGVYFISGTQEGTPIDRALGAVSRRFALEQALIAPQRASGRSYFLERLLSEVVFAEQGLASVRRGWARRQGALSGLGFVAIGVVGAGLAAAWWGSWQRNRDYIEQVAQRTQQVQRLLHETPNLATADVLPLLPAWNAMRALASTGATAEATPSGDRGNQPIPWQMGFGLYQGRALETAAQAVYERTLSDSLLPRVVMRMQDRLQTDTQPQSQYETLKSYLMLYDAAHLDPNTLRAQLQTDWDVSLGRAATSEQRAALTAHLDALLAQPGLPSSPLVKDAALVERTRASLAALALPRRVYLRIRQRGLGDGFPEFNAVKAGGHTVPLLFTRASGEPMTRGVPGLFTYKGYHGGFQPVVDEAAREVQAEQSWVMGSAAAPASKGSANLADDVRTLYLTDYRDTWKAYIADIKLIAPTTLSQALDRTRFLSAPDSPLVPLLKGMARETTLLAPQAPPTEGVVDSITKKLPPSIGKAISAATDGAQVDQPERLVDDEFSGLHRLVTAPEGGKAPIDGVVARLAELQVLLVAADAALKGGAAPQPSPLPNQLKAEAVSAPEPVRSMLDSLSSASGRISAMQMRETLAREVRSQVGEFCQQAVGGRYPFDRNASREVTPSDFSVLFGPGGKFDLMQQRLSAYIDTSTRPWRFRSVDGNPLGADSGSLPQFARAQTIRETYFIGAAQPTIVLTMKPAEMDPALREFVLDVDGQIVRYDHGPQIPQTVRWPGPRGSGVVRVMTQPAGAAGAVYEGPWALMRLFDHVQIGPGSAPEKFRATFDVGGRKVIFDVTASSVRNPIALPELRGFSCPSGL